MNNQVTLIGGPADGLEVEDPGTTFIAIPLAYELDENGHFSQATYKRKIDRIGNVVYVNESIPL